MNDDNQSKTSSTGKGDDSSITFSKIKQNSYCTCGKNL